MKEKGCVYFFRHIGLNPIKIGFSTNESPIDRFNQFQTYAPYGSEIIGFIQTPEAKEIETKLHIKYASKRLSGEWFDITENDALSEIDFYSKVEDIRERNEFQQTWAKYLNDKKQFALEQILTVGKKTKKERFLMLYEENKKLNFVKTSEILGVSRQTLYDWRKELNAKKR